MAIFLNTHMKNIICIYNTNYSIEPNTAVEIASDLSFENSVIALNPSVKIVTEKYCKENNIKLNKLFLEGVIENEKEVEDIEDINDKKKKGNKQ